MKWNEKTNPNELGTSKYPLHKFCYEYIKYQDLDLSEIAANQESFLERKEYERKQRESNTALSILYDFTTQREDILSCAVESVRDDLKNTSIIPLTQYGKLANYLIAVKCIVNNPKVIDECKSIMLENMKKTTQKDEGILDRLRFHDSFGLWEVEQTEEYNNFIKEMSSIFQNTAFVHIENDNPLDYLDNIAQLMCDNDSAIKQRKSFMEKMDIDKILIGLEKASSEQVSEFRRGVLNVYRIANIREFLPNDKDALVELKSGVQNIIETDKGSDKVVKLQYSWLINNIETVLENYQ